jgi:superfamily II DNA helicase RecQ
LLYHSARDLRTQRFFIQNIGDNNPKLTNSEIAALQQIANRKLESMHAYASGYRCRRRQILEYFGESRAVEGCRCDRCRSAAPSSARGGERGISFDEYTQELASRKSTPRVSSARSRGMSSEQQTASVALDAAAQHRLERLKDIRRDLASQLRQPAFCVMHDSALTEVARAAPHALEDLARIKGVGLKKAERFGPALMKAYCLVPQGAAAGSAAPVQPRPALPPAASTSHRVSASIETPSQVPFDLAMDPDIADRLQRLTSARDRLAQQHKLPPYFILYDHALREVAEAVPTSIPELARIASVGDKKAAKFGAELLAAL